MKKYAIIVAGGSGTRFGSTLPKQFIPLGGVPVLMRTIKAFADYDPDINIVVALPSEHLTLWGDLCALRNFAVPHKVVEGGANRFESVRNALFAVNETECLVAVHDGARPLVSRQVIAAGFETAARCGTAIPTVPVTDSIRQLDRNGSHNVSRESLVAVQTPQTFRVEILKEAYTTSFSPLFTDDASVVEFRGTPVTLYPGDVNNIKITHPMDINTAEWILSADSNEQA